MQTQIRIKVIHWDKTTEEERNVFVNRAEIDITSILPGVQEIVGNVESRGDHAVREYMSRYDHVGDPSGPIRVTPEEIAAASQTITPEIRHALDYAIANVRKAHEHQRPEFLVLTQTRPGVLAGERTTPIRSAGLYVPRGRGSFPSMLYMLAVPAQIAGVPRVALATPPSQDGSLDPVTLYTASVCGIDEVYRMGGAYAIAALAFGTETIQAVDKIVGPGSAYVAAAKRLLRDKVDVGLPAGPSESMIIADKDDDPASVAVDLLIEAEHGADSQALLVTPSRTLGEAVANILPGLIEDTPEPRRAFLKSVFSNYGAVILVDNIDQAVEVANLIAPEHLQVRTRDPWSLIESVTGAAEILIGPHSAFSLANYAAGANAVLPTGGAARVWSGVSVNDFVTRSSVVQVTRSGFSDIASQVRALADYEGFHWHSRALDDRVAPSEE